MVCQSAAKNQPVLGQVNMWKWEGSSSHSLEVKTVKFWQGEIGSNKSANTWSGEHVEVGR